MSVSADDLILLAQVVQTGSFSRAAARLGVPKSTVSRRITQLESVLGERVLTRSTRHLLLTDFGQRIYESAQYLVSEQQTLEDWLNDRQTQPEGLLRVSLPAGLIELNLHELVQEYCQRYPKVQLQLDFSPRRVDVIAEQFDIALRAAEQLPDDNTLIATKICDLHYQLYASPAYLARSAALGIPQTPEDLRQHTGLKLMNHMGEALPWSLRCGDALWQGLPQGNLISNSPNFHRAMALSGMGVVALPQESVRSELAQGQLLPILAQWHLPTQFIWAVMPTRRLMPLRVKLLIELMRQNWQ